MRNNPTLFVKSSLSVFLLLVFTSSQAYKVSPLVIELSPTGNGAKTSMMIENTHDYPLTVELSSVSNVVDFDGNITEVNAEDDFLIFPPQAIIRPGQSQRVQVQYIGGPVAESKLYRVIISQVPIDFGNSGPALNINFIFRAALYLVPDGASFDIEVTSIVRTDSHYTVELENNGNRHAVLVTGFMTGRSSSGQEQTVRAETIEALKDHALVPANSKRRILIPLEAFSELNDLESLEIRPER